MKHVQDMGRDYIYQVYQYPLSLREPEGKSGNNRKRTLDTSCWINNKIGVMNDHRLFRVMFIGLLFSVMYFSFDRASNAQASIAPTSSLLHRSSSALPAEQNNQSTLALECHLFHHQLFGARSSCFTSRLNSIEVLASATCKENHVRLCTKVIHVFRTKTQVFTPCVKR